MKYARVYEVLNKDVKDLISLADYYELRNVNTEKINYYLTVCQYMKNQLTVLNSEKEFNPFFKTKTDAITIIVYDLHQDIRQIISEKR